MSANSARHWVSVRYSKKQRIYNIIYIYTHTYIILNSSYKVGKFDEIHEKMAHQISYVLCEWHDLYKSTFTDVSSFITTQRCLANALFKTPSIKNVKVIVVLSQQHLLSIYYVLSIIPNYVNKHTAIVAGMLLKLNCMLKEFDC